MGKISIKWLVGAGAQGRITLDVWRSASPNSEFLFIDDDPGVQGKTVNGVIVQGGIQFLLNNFSPEDEVIVAIGNNKVRASLGKKLESKGLILGNAIHISAVVMRSVYIGGGCMIFAQAVLNSGASLGKHIIVNSGVIVEHDSVIEDCVSLSPGVSMGGRVIIEKGAFIGTGAVLAPRIRIGRGSVVGAGSLVIKDLPSDILAYGVPARVIKQLDKTFDWSGLL